MIKDAINTLNSRCRVLFRLAVLLPIILVSIAVTAQKTQGRKGTFVVPNRKCAVDFLISEAEADSMEQAAEDKDGFYTVQDDIAFYWYESTECLKKHGIKLITVPANYRYIKFPDGTIRTLSTHYQGDIMLYLPGRKPKEADVTMMEEEIKSYFRPIHPKKTQRK